MKFSEFPYKRPDYEKVMSEITALTEKFKAATSAKEQLSIMKELEQIEIETFTASTICNIRYTVDTRDKFYDEEMNFWNEATPQLQECQTCGSKGNRTHEIARTGRTEGWTATELSL